MDLALTMAASVAATATHAWQDGLADCNDGNRYTSGKPQPYPFHRRFCGWNSDVLVLCTLVSLVALGLMMGSWWKAALLLTLPGAWFVTHHPTCTDAVTMALAYGAALLFPTQPWLALLLACLSGFVHERGPVFAALYAWHPLLLLGLVCVGWWRKPAPQDADKLVGVGTWGAIKAHRPYVDLLDGRIAWLGWRTVLPLAAVFGGGVSVWAAAAVAFASRIMGTDSCRYLWWAAPPLVASLNLPSWVIGPALAVHLVTFKRAI